MKRLLPILIFLLLALPARAQEGIKVYLPLLFKGANVALDNSWRVISPVQSSNYVLNPSAEADDNYSAVGSATTERSTTYQKYGVYSYKVTLLAIGDGIQFDLSALTNTEHFVTVRVRGPHPDLLATIGSASKRLNFIEKIDSNWSLYGIAFSKAQVNGQTALQITALKTQASVFYLDGIQVEPLPYWTTYIDGTQEGCEWVGAANVSISRRSAESRAGGKSLEFYNDFGFFVERVVGAGAATKRLGIDSYALLPGGELNNVKVQPREFTIIGRLFAATEQELHDNRQALDALLDNASHPNSQPIRIRFNGARVQKEIGVHYGGGLDGDLAVSYGQYQPGDDSWTKLGWFTEKVAIQFSAPNPYWLEVGESAAVLDTNESAVFRTVAGRLRETGQWSNLGPPSAGGTYANIQAIAEDGTYAYFGGSFSDFNGISAADNIVRYNKHTGVYSALDVGLNNVVLALAVASNGDLYIGGLFTNAGGVGAADFLTRWDGTSFNAVGIPNTGAAAITGVFALKFDSFGNLYIGGSFLNWADIANADGIVMWNGSAYSALSTGANATVRTITVGLNNIIYVGGAFTTIGGVAANRVSSWDGSAFSALSSGLDNDARVLVVDPSTGVLYIVGDFTTAGGITVNYVTLWNGSSFSALGGGLDSFAYSAAMGPDSVLYVGGEFTEAGGVTLADRVARWNGYVWTHLDVDLPGAPIVYSIYASKFVDPVINQKYDLFLSFDTTGTGNFAGLADVENGGSVPAFPKIIFYRSGGTSAIIETLKNERTGKELLFNYSLLDNEALVIDLTPTNKSVTSSFWGPRPDAILANSDFSSWALLKGSNDITSFVAVSGSPTVFAFALWRDAFDGYD